MPDYLPLSEVQRDINLISGDTQCIRPPYRKGLIRESRSGAGGNAALHSASGRPLMETLVNDPVCMDQSIGRNPEGPLTGAPSRVIDRWERLGTANSMVLSILQEGVRIPFTLTPLSHEQENYPLTEAQRLWVDKEITRMLLLGVISPWEEGSRPTVVAPIGVVPKKNGEFRLIIDLRYTNRHIDTPRFQYEDLSTLSSSVEPGDYSSAYDLKNGFWHVWVHPAHRTFLGFCWNCTYYCYNVLPFGLSVSPYYFTKVMRPVVERLRRWGIRCQIYMDDIILMAHSITEHQALRHRLLKLLRKLNIFVNWKKSNPLPSQSTEWLGMIIDTSQERVMIRAPQKKLHTVRHECSRLLRQATNHTVPAR